jgi:CBS domain-containing protein
LRRKARNKRLLVKEIMNKKHPWIYEDELATKARATIRDLSLRILPVVEDHKRLLGKVSRRDVMTISSSVSPIRVKGIMTPAKHVATVNDEVLTTVKAMLQVDVWYAPVVTSSQDRTYMGVVGLENFIEPSIRMNPEKLLKNVSESMTQAIVTCSPEDEVDNIWRLMQQKRLGGLPVVRKGKLAGMVTQKDLLESGSILPAFEAQKGRFQTSSKVSAIMKTGITTARPSTKIVQVAKVMISKDVGRVPIEDENGKLVGIVDREDIARLLVE